MVDTTKHSKDAYDFISSGNVRMKKVRMWNFSGYYEQKQIKHRFRCIIDTFFQKDLTRATNVFITCGGLFYQGFQ